MTQTNTQTELLTEKAIKNIRDTVVNALEHEPTHKALVVYDTENELARILTSAYRIVLPEATFLDFNAHTKEEIIATFDVLSPRDLVVLIQSSDFRLNEFRIRIQLFERKLKVIDHLHLYRNTPDSWETYINALAYDSSWYRVVGPKLKARLESLDTLRITSNDAVLTVTGGLEVPKLNIGDYTGMNNIGGTFPIGEVFTEARDLGRVNGSIYIYAFAGKDFHVDIHEPFRIDIKDGLVVGWGENAPQTFADVIALIQTNERAIVREVGFGLNRAITREHYLKDITAFERIYGMHLSLGEKHTVYKKAGIAADKTRFHVDLFPIVDSVMGDDQLLFYDNTYVV